MPNRILEKCAAGCRPDQLRPVLDLGFSPVTNPTAGELHPLQQVRYPLSLVQCQVCTLVQLSYVVDRKTVFPDHFPYSSGNSPQLHKHFEGLARQFEGTLKTGDRIVDIGANDGTLLSKFPIHFNKIAVEPTFQIDKCGLTIAKFRDNFDRLTAHRIVSRYGKAKLVTACNVLAHVEDPQEVLRGVVQLLDDGGMFVAENHHLYAILNDGQWDTIYHEHLRYYSLFSFTNLLERSGLSVVRYELNDVHGGSFRTYAVKSSEDCERVECPADPHQDFKGLEKQMKRQRAHLRSSISSLRAGDKRVVGIGATARATTLLNYCGLDVEDLECVCEVADSDKIGYEIPGTRIPIRSEEEVLFGSFQPEYALLLSWHLADFLIPKLRQRGCTSTFIVPLPELRYEKDQTPHRGWW